MKALDGPVTEFHALWVDLRNAAESSDHSTDEDRGTVEAKRIWVDLARRHQVVIDELLCNLDKIEGARGESKEIDNLKRLVARLSRTSEGLLLLGGASPASPVWDGDVSVGELVRLARARIENPGQVDSSRLDPALRVASHAASDVVLLLAEVLENAIRYSPPESMVHIEATRHGHAARLRVQDAGIEMPIELIDRLNQQLRNAEIIDAAVPRTMGIAVVAQLAARHRIVVSIGNAPDLGTAVDIELPRALLTSWVHPERTTWARMSSAEAWQILQRIEDRDYKKWVLAGLAAERAEAVLDSTRSPGWPAVTIRPAVHRPGFTEKQ